MAAELRDLELLVAVADAGSITAGAERCGTSLSAASARIATLETHFGVRLLERHRRGVSATAAGAVLVERARGVLAASADVETTMAARARGIAHEIRIAAGSAAVDSLPELVAAALNQMPEVSVDLVEVSSGEAVEAVRAGRADLGVASSVVDARGCDTVHLWNDDLVVIGPRTRGARRPLTLAEVLAEPVVGLSEGVPLQRLVERHARSAGLRPTYRVRFPSLAAVCAVAGTGVGRAVVPRLSARMHGVPPASLHDLDEPWAVRRSTLVVRDLGALTPVTTRFVELLLQHRGEVAGR